MDAALRRGLTRIQVDEVRPEHWNMPGIPQFVIEYDAGHGFLTLTVQLEKDTWYDQNTRLSENEYFLRYPELGPDKAWDPDYQSPLDSVELKSIGIAISNYMVVQLTTYMGLFMPVYRTPSLN